MTTPQDPAEPTPVASTPAQPPKAAKPPEYKGEPLDAARGPGLGCFWIQIGVLVFLVVLTPLSVNWQWPSIVSAVLLVLILLVLLFAGQTVIFLLRLVAAGRGEGRRRPIASATPTVGEIEETVAPAAAGDADPSVRE